MQVVQTYSMPATDRSRFRALAEKHMPEEEARIEDSLEVIDRVVEQGPGPLSGLSPADRIKVLKMAIEAFPPGPENLLLGQLAWMTLSEVEKVRTSDEEVKSSNLKFHLNGETAFIALSPPAERPSFSEAYSDFLELRELAGQGGAYSHQLNVEARSALNLELHHFHGDPEEIEQFRTLLGVIGSPTLATLGIHRLKRFCSEEDRARAIERMGQLRPGLENNQYHDLIPMAPRLGEKTWQRLSQADSYSSAILSAKLLHALGLSPEENWEEFESFSEQFLELKMERKDVENTLLWVTDHYHKLKVGFSSEDNLMGFLANHMEKAWQAPPQEGKGLNPYLQSRERLEGVLGGLASEAAVKFAETGLGEPDDADTSILMFDDAIEIGDFTLEIQDHG